MSPSHLVACPTCARHLRVSEPLCPFCGHAVDADLRARPAPRPPAMRLGRAALFALGTGAASLASTACSSSSTTTSVGDGGHSGSTTGSAVSGTPLYGGMGSMTEHSSDTGSNTGSNTASAFSATPLYGASASMPEHSSDTTSSSTAGVSGIALYGGMGSMTEHSSEGSGDSSGHAKDAGAADSGRVGAAYGGPPPRELGDFCDEGCGGLPA